MVCQGLASSATFSRASSASLGSERVELGSRNGLNARSSSVIHPAVVPSENVTINPSASCSRSTSSIRIGSATRAVYTMTRLEDCIVLLTFGAPPRLYELLLQIRLAGSVPRSGPQDGAAQEAVVQSRTRSESWPGEVRLGATQRAGRCSSARSKPAGGVFLRPTPEQHSSLTHP